MQGFFSACGGDRRAPAESLVTVRPPNGALSKGHTLVTSYAQTVCVTTIYIYTSNYFPMCEC